jgi:putative transposase
MANTYSQVHLHFVFTVKYRTGIIRNEWKDRLYQYISGIVQKNEHKMIAINGMSDHIHMLVGFRMNQSIAGLMKDVKQFSSKWINENKLVPGRFEWQEGYGVFSYSMSHVKSVIDYILNQDQHHKKKTFLAEYKEFLEKFGIEYDERFIFKELK